MKYFYGNATAILLYFFGTSNATLIDMMFGPGMTDYALSLYTRTEIGSTMKFIAGILKSAGYPLGLLLQILTVVFLVRGNSGYSRSARSWFLLVLGADIGSSLYRVYDLITVDFLTVNPYIDTTENYNIFGMQFLYFIWGLRSMSDANLQDVLCKTFFVILYFPIFLSPITLTISSLIRCYCVKFPLRAKAKLTTRVDRSLMAFSVLLSLAISAVIGGIVVEGWSSDAPKTAFGVNVYYGDCEIPRYDFVATNRIALFAGLNFMLAIVFMICAANVLSAIIIIVVLFEAKKNRNSLSASDATDSKAEVRATAMLLGMNVTLFVCFFVSRLMVVISNKMNLTYQPVAYIVQDRLSGYLFNIPYIINWLFIAGLTRKFYEFYLPFLASKETRTTSAVSQKTMEESKFG